MSEIVFQAKLKNVRKFLTIAIPSYFKKKIIFHLWKFLEVTRHCTVKLDTLISMSFSWIPNFSQTFWYTYQHFSARYFYVWVNFLRFSGLFRHFCLTFLLITGFWLLTLSMARTTRPSIGLRHAPQIGISDLSWHLLHRSFPRYSWLSPVSSLPHESQLKW